MKLTHHKVWVKDKAVSLSLSCFVGLSVRLCICVYLLSWPLLINSVSCQQPHIWLPWLWDIRCLDENLMLGLSGGKCCETCFSFRNKSYTLVVPVCCDRLKPPQIFMNCKFRMWQHWFECRLFFERRTVGPRWPQNIPVTSLHACKDQKDRQSFFMWIMALHCHLVLLKMKWTK